MSRQLPDEYLTELFDKLEEAGHRYALAKAKRFGLAEQRKIVKNQLMMVAEASGYKSHVAQEKAAYTNPVYIKLVEDLVAAIQEETDSEYACKLVEMSFEGWRSVGANLRAARV